MRQNDVHTDDETCSNFFVDLAEYPRWLFPLMAGGRIIGAIGASGAAGKVIGAEDDACARAGREAIAAKLFTAHDPDAFKAMKKSPEFLE